ncbi:MAG: hypothetical protein Q4E45_10095 [Eubacteriales bacterium]|nr:hypothetical protein [Eubacteriales bacterium]
MTAQAAFSAEYIRCFHALRINGIVQIRRPIIGATPDGRFAEEPIAHGCNPMHGRNTNGVTATAKSLLKVPFREYQGGSL